VRLLLKGILRLSMLSFLDSKYFFLPRRCLLGAGSTIVNNVYVLSIIWAGGVLCFSLMLIVPARFMNVTGVKVHKKPRRAIYIVFIIVDLGNQIHRGTH